MYCTRQVTMTSYTPDYGVASILEFIPEGKIIWCPFDTGE